MKKIITGLIDDIRSFAAGARGSYSTALTDTAQNFKERKWLVFFFYNGLAILGCCYMSVYSTLRDGSEDVMMSIFIPQCIAVSIMVFFAFLHRSSPVFTAGAVAVISFGIAMQVYMLDPTSKEAQPDAAKIIIILFVGLVASLLLTPLVKYITSGLNIKKTVLFVDAASLLIYLFLAVFGKNIGGAKGWIFIGGVSFQLTEITKVLAVLAFSLCMYDDGKTAEKEKTWLARISLILHAVCLALICSELGTLAVILLTYFIVNFVFRTDKKVVLAELLVLAVLGASALAASGVVYRFTKPDTVETTAAEAEVTTAAPENEEPEGVTSHSGGEEEKSAGERSAVKELLYTRVGRVYEKVMSRFGKSANADDYQRRQADKALLGALLIGDSEGSLAGVPLISSDMVFVYIAVRLGIVWTVFVLCLFIVMMFEVFFKTARSDCRNNAHGIFMCAFAGSVFMQAFISAASATGLLPIIGVQFPFFGAGGSAMCVNMLMVILAIDFLGKANTEKEIAK